MIEVTNLFIILESFNEISKIHLKPLVLFAHLHELPIVEPVAESD